MFHSIDRQAFRSKQQFTTIATAQGPTGKQIQIATTADTGSGINCISPELAERLGLTEE